MFFRALFAVCLALVAASAQAAPVEYVLDPRQSRVSFTWFYGESPVSGQIAIGSADLTLDLDNIGRSDVRVSLEAGTAQAGFLFATQALRGRQMFDAENYPEITFSSDGFRLNGGAVSVDGQVTIRGVTRPLVMQATLFRQEGTEPTDRDHLAIELVGAIDRHEFGASGFPDEVGSDVEIRILAYIDRAP